MMEFLFLDLDDTILDFHKAERIALSRTLESFGVAPEDEVLARYHVINLQHWERLETGELTRDQVQEGRFRVLFQELGMEVDPVAVTRTYERNLGIGHYFLPGAEEAVQSLHKKYRLFLASNGTASVQHSRLTSAGLYPYFEKVFVSQDIGYNKPARDYFEACFRQIPDFCPERAIMVGDSLTSDILGGINAGIRTCWVNPQGNSAPEAYTPTWQIGSLSELPALLESINAGKGQQHEEE